MSNGGFSLGGFLLGFILCYLFGLIPSIIIMLVIYGIASLFNK